MMGLGHLGSGTVGNSSSTPSNLSALAPPFTVDRLNPNPNRGPNPNPNPNPASHYSVSDAPYTVGSYQQSWQHMPSAPGPELLIDSTGGTSTPSSNAFKFSSSGTISPVGEHWAAPSFSTKALGNQFAFGSEFNPHFPPYVPSMVDRDGLLVHGEESFPNMVPTSGLSVLGPVDYAQSSFGSEYGHGAQWDERVELSQSFHDGSNRGGYNSGNKNKYKEDFGLPYKKLNLVSDGEVHTAFLTLGHVEEKSYPEQIRAFFASDSNNTFVLDSSSTCPQSHPSAFPSEIHDAYSNYQSSFSPFEKCIVPGDNVFTSPPSVMRPSPAVIIRPPPSANGNMGKSLGPRKPARSTSGGGGLHLSDFDHSNPKDSALNQSYGIRAESYETNLIDFSKNGDGLVSSTPVKELSSSLLTRNALDFNVKPRFSSQLLDINVSGGSAVACDNVHVVNSIDVSSDFIDPHNTAVDSPCWKGATSSKFSPFDEVGNPNISKRSFGEYFGFGHEDHQNLHAVVGSSRVAPETNNEGNKNNQNEWARNGGETTGNVLSSNEQGLSDDDKGRVWISTMNSSKGLVIGCDPYTLGKESGLTNNLTGGFDMKASVTNHLIDEVCTGMILNDVSAGGAIAVHTAEKVLASPASQEDATECPKQPAPKLNAASSMIKAIHDLSELLLFHISNDACSLEEEYSETLKHIISNLDSCLRKKISTQEDGPNNSGKGASDKLRESCRVGTTSGGTVPTNNGAISHVRLGPQNEEGSCSFFGKKDEKSPINSPLVNDFNITNDDEMVKAIKKVLEEDYHLDEETHSQGLIFKSLWLEAEAKLCSIGCKSRFDRMKIQLEGIKLDAPLQENQDLAEMMMSEVYVGPDPVNASELAPKSQGEMTAETTLQKCCETNSVWHDVDDMESSMMARLNILRSREENLKSTNVEEQQKVVMVDGDHSASIMARLNILKSREENMKTIKMEEQQKTEMVEVAATSTGENDTGPCIRGVWEKNETSNVAPNPFFPRVSRIKVADGFGYESQDEFQLSRIDALNKRIYSGWQGSLPSSDWEHVQKEDLPWKS